MASAAAIAAISALAGAALLTQVMRVIARGGALLDVPNARSSHAVPTPRGGGAAIVLVTTAGVIAGALRGEIAPGLAIALAVGGTAVGLVGFADDRGSLPAGVRLGVHFGAALVALKCLGGLPPLLIGGHLFHLGWTGYVLGSLGIVWTVNLFNFMDGIDGLAASEALFVAAAGSTLSLVTNGAPGVSFIGLVIAAACGGFLLWNWPPAKIFLGDVGSGYLGYVIGVLALAAAQDNAVALWVWLILGGVFFVDATVTLLRRLLRGERVYQAHRDHAYQWLARRWGSHAKVSLLVTVANILWLLPCAALAAKYPRYAAAGVIVALAPLTVLALKVSGRRGPDDERAGHH